MPAPASSARHAVARISLVLLAAAAAAWLATAPAPARAAPPDADGPAWLARINQAASAQNYRGTMVFSAGGVMSSSRVAHLAVGDQIYERVEVLDGHLQRVYRHNETVHTVWPHRKVVVVEKQAAAPGLVSTRRRVDVRALEHYALQVTGAGHVAGRPVRQLMLAPRDGWRFAQRLWADEASGLLLRTDVVADDGRVLESSAFTEVAIGGRAEPQPLMRDMTPPGYTMAASGREAVDWQAQGWALRETLPGFQLLGCVRRPAPGHVAEGHALQAVFTDGLSYVSIFIEPFRDHLHRRALAAEMGATHTVMQRLGDHWITAMGDVPRRTLEAFIGALEQRR